MTEANVLVITADEDGSADLVSAHVRKLGGKVSRFDVADFPIDLVIDAHTSPGSRGEWSGTVSGRGATLSVDLECLTGVYYRKPTPFRFPDGMSVVERRFAELEARAGFLGVMASVRATWINHPLTELPASYKPLQLAHAASFGLMPPRSLVSNSPDAVLRFASALGGTVLHKGIGKDLVGPGSVPIPTTRAVSSAELYASDGLEITSHLFQEVIEKTHDVRVTAVGRWMCAVEIHTSSSVLDWRTAYDEHDYAVVRVPAEVATGLRSVMKVYNLVYATFDFAVDRSGSWRFLEMNSNGEWLWLENALGLGIGKHIAAALVKN